MYKCGHGIVYEAQCINVDKVLSMRLEYKCRHGIVCEAQSINVDMVLSMRLEYKCGHGIVYEAQSINVDMVLSIASQNRTRLYSNGALWAFNDIISQMKHHIALCWLQITRCGCIYNST